MVGALADNGNLESANRLHDSVVGRVEHNSGDAIFLLLKEISGSSLLSIGSGLLSLGLGSQCFAHGLLGVFLTSELTGGLGTVVGTRLGSLGHNLLAGLGLQIDEADVGVLQADTLHGVDVLTTVALELGQGGVKFIQVLKLAELLSGAALDVSLLRLHDDSLLGAVLLVQVFVEEETAVSNESGVDSDGEVEEGDDSLPDLNLSVGDGTEDEVEPDVGKDGPGGGDEEDTQMLDLPHLVVGDDVHAETDDHEEIEGGGTDNCSGSQISGLEVLGPDLNDRQHDLGSRRAEGHESQVGHGLVPDLDDDDLGLAGTGILDGHLLLLGGDHLDGLHELVGGDSNTNKEVDHQAGVQHTTSESVSSAHFIGSGPQRNKKSIITVNTFVSNVFCRGCRGLGLSCRGQAHARQGGDQHHSCPRHPSTRRSLPDGAGIPRQPSLIVYQPSVFTLSLYCVDGPAIRSCVHVAFTVVRGV